MKLRLSKNCGVMAFVCQIKIVMEFFPIFATFHLRCFSTTVLKATEKKLIGSKENSVTEQRRIKELMSDLNREDELHSRYLKKLSALESEIESSAERLITVRKELEDSKTRLGQD